MGVGFEMLVHVSVMGEGKVDRRWMGGGREVDWTGGGREVDGRWAGRLEVDAVSGMGPACEMRLTVVGAAAVARIAGRDAVRGSGGSRGEGEHVGERVWGLRAERSSVRGWSDDERRRLALKTDNETPAWQAERLRKVWCGKVPGVK